MAIQSEGWRSEIDGTLFESERLATEHDMKLVGERIAPPNMGLVVFANIINNKPEETIRLLTAYLKCHPKAGAIPFTPRSDDEKLEALRIKVREEAATAIRQMQAMKGGKDDPAVRKWLADNQFLNVADFQERAGYDDIVRWEHFVADLEDGPPPIQEEEAA